MPPDLVSGFEKSRYTLILTSNYLPGFLLFELIEFATGNNGKKRKFPEKSQFDIHLSIMNREKMKKFLTSFNIKNAPDFVARLKNDEIFRKDVNRILRENYCSI